MTLESAINDYKAKTARSRQLFEEALRVMPGGNSRTTTFFDPYPFYIARGEGPRIWDADGAERSSGSITRNAGSATTARPAPTIRRRRFAPS
jgi:hypothetical protein